MSALPNLQEIQAQLNHVEQQMRDLAPAAKAGDLDARINTVRLAARKGNLRSSISRHYKN